ncbi:hypothetical protein BH11PLA2_BH11PLA2_26960 [soil metagenome]
MDNTPITLRVLGPLLKVVPTNISGTVYAQEPLSTVSGAVLTSNSFDVQLTVDASVPQLSGTIQFLGGIGNTTLVAPGGNNDWHLFGSGNGNLRNPGFVTYTNVRNLTGNADEDRFFVRPGGSLAGIMDGGGQGLLENDQLFFDDGITTPVKYIPTGGSAGSMALAGGTLNYAGLEPVSLYLSQFTDAANVTLTGNPVVNNDIFVGPYNGELLELVRSGERYTFRAPGTSLTVDLAGAGQNTLRIGSAITPMTLPGSLTVRGGVQADHIIVQGALSLSGELDIDANATPIDAYFGLDTVDITGSVATRGSDVLITAGTVTIADKASLDAGQYTAGVVSGNAVAITIKGRTLTIGQSAKLLALGKSSFTPGDITVQAGTIQVLGVLPVNLGKTDEPSLTVRPGAEIRGDDVSLRAYQGCQTGLRSVNLLTIAVKKAGVRVSGAVIDGTTVAISAESKDDADPTDGSTNLVNNLKSLPFLATAYADIPALLKAPVIMSSVSVQKRSATAEVTVTGSSITSRGDVSIVSTVTVASDTAPAGGADGQKKGLKLKTLAEFAPFAAGYSYAAGRAVTSLDGTSMIDAGGSVSILSNTSTSAVVEATTTANAAAKVHGPKTYPTIAIGVTQSETVSNTFVGTAVRITAAGNVNVHADADTTTNAHAGVAVFGDGMGGLGFALGTDNTDVKSRVDGQITAGGKNVIKEIVLNTINQAADTIRLPNHGLTDGQLIAYRAATPESPTIPVQAIGGLTDRDVYRVMVVDASTIKLTRAQGLTLDDTGLDPRSVILSVAGL